MGIEIEVGGVYTNKRDLFAREIIEIAEGMVAYRDFVLHSGEAMSSLRTCTRATFRHWATRCCTPAEVARLNKSEEAREDRMLRDCLSGLRSTILEALSDAELLAEVRRRGLKLDS